MSIWLKRLAVIALLGFPVALAGKRLDLFHFGISFQIMQATLLLALLVFFTSIIVALRNRKTRPHKSSIARAAIYISLIPIIGLGSQIFKITSVPEIHNITTDTVNPPNFNKVPALRGAHSNPHEYNANELASLQVAAYPEVKTYVSDQASSDVFAKALRVVKDLGWVLVSQDTRTGIIEATETTTLWAFKDDVVIRVSQLGDKTAVDLRSVSRIGRSDLGVNAKRIKTFLEALKS